LVAEQVQLEATWSGWETVPVTSIGGYANWNNMSDKRIKKNITTNVPGLAFVNKLNPVTYNLDLEASDRIVKPPRRTDKEGRIIPLSEQELTAKKEKRANSLYGVSCAGS